MRLVYFGSGAFGLPTLAALAARHQLAAVVTQPDKPAGRGGHLTPTPVAAWAAQSCPQIPVLKPEKVNDPSMVAKIRNLGADAWVVIAFGQKLGKSLLEGVFAINLHASLLPRWRGAAPINAAILAGDSITGNSVITLADRMDAGRVLGQSQRSLDSELTAGDLHDQLAADGPELVLDVLRRRETGSLESATQDEALVTVAPKLSKLDGWVDFRDPAETCRRRIHGLTPWPGVTVRFRQADLKLARVEVCSHSPAQHSVEGSVIDPIRGIVECGSGTALRIVEVTPAGRKSMRWEDFARGQRVRKGELLLGRHGGQGPPC